MPNGLVNQAQPPATIQGDVNVTQPLDVHVTNQPIDVDVLTLPSPIIVRQEQSANLDAFQRLRISSTGQRVDSAFTYDKQPMLFDEIISGTGTASHSTNLRSVYLTTGGLLAGASASLRLKYHTPYTPGNSQLIFITGTLNPDATADWTNVRAEIGYATENNGVGFRYDETGAHIFLRSSISGAPADLVLVDQAAWNINTVPGVDWTKSQIFGIDFQSLAVGRIRFFLDISGSAVLVHEIYNDNLRVGPYWQTASLPPVWSVTNTGAANSVCRVLAICVTVKSEGAENWEDIHGFPFSASNGATPKTVSTTLVPVMSIQLKTLFNGLINRSIVVPQDVIFMGTNPFLWQLIYNPTLTGSVFNSVDANSVCNFSTAATVIAGGRVIASGYSSGGSGGVRGTGGFLISGRVPLSVNAPGTVGDILTMACQRVGSSDSAVNVAINWQEVR
jgi:hypothetical protein